MLKRVLIALVGLCACLSAVHAHAQSTSLIFPQLGHHVPIMSIAFSPDGRLLASGSLDNTIGVWDLTSGRELRSLGGHKATVDSLAFSPDGKLLASASDNTIKLWDVANWREVLSLQGDKDENGSGDVTSIAFAPGGKTLAVASSNGDVQIWDLASARVLKTFNAKVGSPGVSASWVGTSVVSVAFSPDGRVLATGGQSNAFNGGPLLTSAAITLWGVATGRQLRAMVGHTEEVESVAFSPDGKTLASASHDKNIKLWNVADGRELRTLAGHTGAIYSVAFSRDGKSLASASSDHSVRLWDVASGREERTMAQRTDAVQVVRFSPSGRMLASAGYDDIVTLWDATTGGELRSLRGRTDSVSSVAVSPDQTVVASGDEDGTVKLWDRASGREQPSLGLTDASTSIGAIAISTDGKTLAAGDSSGSIELWDLASHRAIRTLRGPSKAVLSIALSPDGATLASASADRTIKLWEVATGRELRTLSGQIWGLRSVAFSPDGTILACASGDGIKLWDVATGRELRTMTVATYGQILIQFASVAFSPDGKTLASGDQGTSVGPGEMPDTVKLWDVASGRLLRTLTGHTSWIETVRFSPDGKTLASAGNDHTIRFWDVASGAQIRTLDRHLGDVTSVAFSSDGATLVSGAFDGTTRVWDVATGRELASLIAFNDGSSIAVTPEGFFASSGPQAEENLNVRIGEHVYGISSFRENFDRPDLVQRALAGEDISQYGDIANVKLSPEIELANLPATTGDTSLKVTVKLTDGGGGLGAVRLFQKGTVVLQDDATGGASRTYTLPLSPGVNDLKVTAANLTGDMWSEATTQVTSTLPANDNAARPKGTLHAIVIGEDQFPKLPDLAATNAVSDADLFKATLEKAAGPLFAQVDIQELSTPETTDRASIEAAIKAMQTKVKPGDAFVFYVAGHGVVRGGQYYVVTANTSGLDPDTLAKDALSRGELTDLLANVHTANKIVFIDTCQAGGLTEDKTGFATRGMDPKEAARIVSNQIGLNMLMGSAASEHEAAYVEGHGVFTYVLAQGLSGKALDATSGLVTTKSLGAYVDTEVPPLALTANSHAPQQPLDNQPGQPFPIAKGQ